MKIQINPSKLKYGQLFDAKPKPDSGENRVFIDQRALNVGDVYVTTTGFANHIPFSGYNFFVEISHPELVAALCKPGEAILASLTPEKCHLDHMAHGIAGEAGELVDAIKKHTVYEKPLDRENIIEELGDLEWYMEGLRSSLGITREEVLEANIAKLAKRYAGLTYSDKAAQDRADKVEGGQPQ